MIEHMFTLLATVLIRQKRLGEKDADGEEKKGRA
jgi:hypothetical protein